MSSASSSIVEGSLSTAWVNVLQRTLERGCKEISPLVVSVTGFKDGHPIENDKVRQLLDETLVDGGYSEVHTVANTIFPVSLWNPKMPRNALFERYKRVLPKLRKCSKNKYGVYFERLILYREEFNQIDYIIGTFIAGNHRRTALQCVILDPLKDSTNQRQRGFPCLQQVSFSHIAPNGLIVSGYYPHQYIFERAYGNYLGLCRLGSFVAHELGRELVRMNCFVNIAERDMKMSDAKRLAKAIEEETIDDGDVA